MKIIHDIRGLNGLHSETFLNQLGTIKSEFQHTDKNYKVQKPLNCPQQRWTKEMQEIGSSDTNSTSSEDARFMFHVDKWSHIKNLKSKSGHFLAPVKVRSVLFPALSRAPRVRFPD